MCVCVCYITCVHVYMVVWEARSQCQVPSTITIYLYSETRVSNCTWTSPMGTLPGQHALGNPPVSVLSHRGYMPGFLRECWRAALSWFSHLHSQCFHLAVTKHFVFMLPFLSSCRFWLLRVFWYYANKPFKSGIRYNTVMNLLFWKKSW